MGDESRFRYRLLDEGMPRENAHAAPRVPAQEPRRIEPRGIDTRARSYRDYPQAQDYSRSQPSADYSYARAPAAPQARMEPQLDVPGADYGRAPARGGSQDSLAELAKLIGDEDHFSDFSEFEQEAGAEHDDADPYAPPQPLSSDRVPVRAEQFAAPVPSRAVARTSSYGTGGGYSPRPQETAPYQDAKPYSSAHYDDDAYGQAAPVDRAERYDDTATYGAADRYDDSAYGSQAAGEPAYDDYEDTPEPAPRAAQVPARYVSARDSAGYPDSRAAATAVARTQANAVRTGYGSLARQSAPPAPKADAGAAYGERSRSARAYDQDEYEDRNGYGRSAQEPAASGGRGYDARAYDARDYDDDLADDERSYDDRGQDAGRYDAGGYDARRYDERAYDERAYDQQAYGGRRRGDTSRGAYGDAHGEYEADDAAYAYSAERRDDYDAYDDAYDPQFADEGYMPPHGEDVYDSEPRHRRKGRMALLMVASVIGLILAGVAAFFAYQMAVGGPSLVSSGSPPVIRADASPSKIVSPAPTTPADSQQKLIYDRVGDGANPNERMVPREEQPVDVATASTGTTGQASPTEPKRVRTLTVRADGTIVQGGAPGEVSPAPPGSPVTAYAPDQNPIPTSLPAPTTVSTVSTPGATQTATLTTTPAVSASGAYVVQVASQRSENDAMGSWRALQKRYPNLLSSYRASVKRVDLADRGTFYRVQLGPFALANEANELCQALRGQGADCIVSKN